MDKIIQIIRQGEELTKHYRNLHIYIKEVNPNADLDVCRIIGETAADMIQGPDQVFLTDAPAVDMVDAEMSLVDPADDIEPSQRQSVALPDNLKDLRQCADRILCEEHDIRDELWLSYLKEIRHFIGPRSSVTLLDETNDLVKELAADICRLHERIVSLDCGDNLAFGLKVERYRREAGLPRSLITVLDGTPEVQGQTPRVARLAFTSSREPRLRPLSSRVLK
ncbi:hypothetical protein FRC00_002521 [Tulasnella sp. 408]|nr:hypothetical protein FRC00_002521 [Tulasnella sp. 408]